METLYRQLKHTGFPDEALGFIEAHRKEMSKKRGEWFNTGDNYKDATSLALAAKVEAAQWVKKQMQGPNVFVSPLLKPAPGRPVAGRGVARVDSPNLLSSGGAERVQNVLHKATKILRENKASTEKILLITDITENIDDTLALLALAAAEDHELVAVVDCDHRSIEGAAKARGWLRTVGVQDADCMVAGPDNSIFSPDNFLSGIMTNSGLASMTLCEPVKLILSFAERYRHDLIIVAIG